MPFKSTPLNCTRPNQDRNRVGRGLTYCFICFREFNNVEELLLKGRLLRNTLGQQANHPQIVAPMFRR